MQVTDRNYFRFLQSNQFTGSVIFLANISLTDLYVQSNDSFEFVSFYCR